MGWIKNIKERRNAKDDLLYVLHTNPATAGADGWAVAKISPETAILTRKFITRHALKHKDVSHAVLRVLNKYHDAETRINIVLRNFDYAVGLGWSHAPSAFSFILDAIDEYRESIYRKDRKELTTEQEQALMLLEDSQWIKSEPLTRRYTCSRTVIDMVIQRPQDVAAITEIAEATDVTHKAQLLALLDGEIEPALGSGVL